MAMMVARLLWPWEVLDMDLQDMEQVSSTGNRYLLVVDGANRFVFASPVEPKDSVCAARKHLGLLLAFGVPLSIRSETEGEVYSQSPPTPVAEKSTR